jgi:N-acetylmuramoyl-L-alanine amidase
MSAFTPDYGRAVVCPSPNFGERRGVDAPDAIILHYTGMPTEQGAIDWLCTPESEVSSHYVVNMDGTVYQLVPERLRAWHAGRSHWKGEADLNSRSVGIEVANPGHPALPDFPERQIAAVIALCRDITQRWAIAPERLLAHSDVAPVRKIDPGERFPWAALHENGIGHWVPPAAIAGGRFFQLGDAGPPVEALQSMLALSRRFNVISVPRKSMASPMSRRSTRCTGCLPPCRASWSPDISTV